MSVYQEPDSSLDSRKTNFAAYFATKTAVRAIGPGLVRSIEKSAEAAAELGTGSEELPMADLALSVAVLAEPAAVRVHN